MTDATNKTKPVVTSFKHKLKDFDHNVLQAGPENNTANSGQQMYIDFERLDFVINGKKIDATLIYALKQGAQRNKSQILNYSSLYNSDVDDTDENTTKRELDTDHGKAFANSLLKDLDKEFAPILFDKLWEKHYKDTNIPDDQKTDPYKVEFEKFYNIGRKYIPLLPTIDDGNWDYRPFAKEVFKEMFEYAGASIPTDAILEELVTNCNQAGYRFATSMPVLETSFSEHGLKGVYQNEVINIDCTDQNLVKAELDMTIPVVELDNPENEVCKLHSLLKFTLKSKDGKNVTYEDGNLSLTVPKILKNYNIDDKNLLKVIKKYLQKFCEKLGFKFKEEIQIKHNFSQPLDNQPSEKGHLNSPINVVILSQNKETKQAHAK